MFFNKSAELVIAILSNCFALIVEIETEDCILVRLSNEPVTTTSSRDCVSSCKVTSTVV
ncbi:hypothetical protein D3C85_1874830 [compost metagenome]